MSSSFEKDEASPVPTARETMVSSSGGTVQRRRKGKKSKGRRSGKESRSKTSHHKSGSSRGRTRNVEAGHKDSRARASRSDVEGGEGRDEERDESSQSETVESQLQQLSLDEEETCDKEELETPDANATLEATLATIELLQQLHRAVADLAMHEGTYAAYQLDTVARQTGVYGAGMLNAEAGETMKEAQARLSAAAHARRTYASRLDTHILKRLTEFEVVIQKARGQMRKLEHANDDKLQCAEAAAALDAFNAKAAVLMDEFRAALHESDSELAMSLKRALSLTKPTVVSAPPVTLVIASRAVEAVQPGRETDNFKLFVDDVRNTIENDLPNVYRDYVVSKFSEMLYLLGYPNIAVVIPSSDGSLMGDSVLLRSAEIKAADNEILLAAFNQYVEAVDFIQTKQDALFQVFCRNSFGAAVILSKKTIRVGGRIYEVSRPIVDVNSIPAEPEAANDVHLEWRPLRGVNRAAVAVIIKKLFPGCMADTNKAKTGVEILAASQQQARVILFIIRSLHIRGQLAMIHEKH